MDMDEIKVQKKVNYKMMESNCDCFKYNFPDWPRMRKQLGLLENKYFLLKKHKLTQISLIDFPTLIHWVSPFVI